MIVDIYPDDPNRVPNVIELLAMRESGDPEKVRRANEIIARLNGFTDETQEMQRWNPTTKGGTE